MSTSPAPSGLPGSTPSSNNCEIDTTGYRDTRLSCLVETKLYRKQKPNKTLGNTWSSLNKSLNTPNLLVTPNYLQILKDAQFFNATNYQIGGGPAEEAANKAFIDTENKNVKIQYSYQIITLLKRALQRLNANGIYLDIATITAINAEITKLQEAETKLSEIATNIVSAGHISANGHNVPLGPDGKVKPEMSGSELQTYVDTHKALSVSADRNASKLNAVIFKLFNIALDPRFEAKLNSWISSVSAPPTGPSSSAPAGSSSSASGVPSP